MLTESKQVVKVRAEKHSLIAQGAEAKIYSGSFYGKKCVAKVRFAKKYRHPILDAKLRETRTIREARALLKAARYGIHVPLLLGVDKETCTLWMEKIDGYTVKELLDKEDAKQKALMLCNKCQNNPNSVTNKSNTGECFSCNNNEETIYGSTSNELSEMTIRLLTEIGHVVGQMHNHNIIHGDLTTSNFMYCLSTEELHGVTTTTNITDNVSTMNNQEAKSNLPLQNCSSNSHEWHTRNKLVVLDFGLINEKNSVEERAVDLFVLEKAIMATHPFIVDDFNKADNNDNTHVVGDIKCKTNIVADEDHHGSCSANNHSNKRQFSRNGVDYIYRGYVSAVTDTRRCEATLARLAAVRARGRKKSMIG